MQKNNHAKGNIDLPLKNYLAAGHLLDTKFYITNEELQTKKGSSHSLVKRKKSSNRSK
jgi:hypothetical protein